MASITHVKAAQQRYQMVPVLDADGKQKSTPVLRKDGSVKTTKGGRQIVMRLTVADKTKPLANRKCDKCGTEIKVGDPYKHISPKSGPYGGTTRYRCGPCPSWDVWEYSSSLGARTAEISHNFWEAQGDWETEADVTNALNEAAEAIRGLAEEKTQSAENMEEGFGHETSVSEELKATAESLEGWADELEQLDIPEFDHEIELVETEGEAIYWVCSCDEDEHFDTEEDAEGHKEEALNTWQGEVNDAVSLIDECPV